MLILRFVFWLLIINPSLLTSFGIVLLMICFDKDEDKQNTTQKTKKMTNNQVSRTVSSSTSISTVAIFQHYQRTQFTFHNSYVLVKIVPSTLTFLTELRF
jgi:mannitol-specific phosphotransferase system IIBC component